MNAVRTAALVLSLGLTMNPLAWAQPAKDGPKLILLSNLYAEGSYNTAAYVCSTRFPDEKAGFTASLADWRKRHAAEIADVRDLDTQLSAAARAAPEVTGLTQDDLLALRTFGTVRMLGSLAEAQDPQARELCGTIRGQLDKDDPLSQATLGEARGVARELLKRGKSASPP